MIVEYLITIAEEHETMLEAFDAELKQIIDDYLLQVIIEKEVTQNDGTLGSSTTEHFNLEGTVESKPATTGNTSVQSAPQKPASTYTPPSSEGNALQYVS